MNTGTKDKELLYKMKFPDFMKDLMLIKQELIESVSEEFKKAFDEKDYGKIVLLEESMNRLVQDLQITLNTMTFGKNTAYVHGMHELSNDFDLIKSKEKLEKLDVKDYFDLDSFNKRFGKKGLNT